MGRGHGDRVLQHAEDPQHAALGAAAVEAEGELLQVAVELVVMDRPLVVPQQEALEQGDGQVADQGTLPGLARLLAEDDLVMVVALPELAVPLPAVRADKATRDDVLLDEVVQGRCRAVGDALQADAPNVLPEAVAEILDGHSHHGLAPGAASGVPVPGRP